MVIFWLKGAQWSRLDDLVFHEKLKYKIALWDYSTMGNSVLVLWKADKVFSYLRLWSKGLPRAPPGYPMVPNGRPIFLWDDLTVGKLGVNCMKGGQRNI